MGLTRNTTETVLFYAILNIKEGSPAFFCLGAMSHFLSLFAFLNGILSVVANMELEAIAVGLAAETATLLRG
jgi:hypothetical protein